MSLPGSRNFDMPEIHIDETLCHNCGECAEHCNGKPLHFINGKIEIIRDYIFDCIGCGHCMAVCPNGAIQVTGRDISISDIFDINKKDLPKFNNLYDLFAKRRSVRSFKKKEIEQDIIDMIIEAAATAPMGLPPTEVEVMVLKGREKVRQFRDDFLDEITKMYKFFNRKTLPFMKLFMAKEEYQMLDKFMFPLIELLIDKRNDEKDYLFYNAPLAVYFTSTKYADPADCYIAATYAMLAAESLGIGNIMIGSVGPFLKSSFKDLKAKYNITEKSQSGLFVLFGYSDVHFKKGIKRRFAKVTYA